MIAQHRNLTVVFVCVDKISSVSDSPGKYVATHRNILICSIKICILIYLTSAQSFDIWITE